MVKKIDRIDGSLAVKFSVYELAEIRSLLNSNSDLVIIIDSTEFDDEGRHCFPDRDLNVLEDLPIKHLLIYGAWCQNYDGIKKLKHLKSLDVSICSNFSFDFSENKSLTHLEVEWSSKVMSVASLELLEILRLLKYKSSVFNLTEFKELKKLRKISIAQSNIKSLMGIEKLTDLTELNIAYCKDLNVDDAIRLPFVENLTIEKCPNLSLIALSNVFPNLKKLEIFGQPAVDSIKPLLDGLKKLEKFSISATKINESDNSYWLNYRHIKEFYFQDMRHLKLKYSEFEKLKLGADDK